MVLETAMLDLLILNANLPNGERNVSIAVKDGRIVEVSANSIEAEAARKIDAAGQLVSTPFVDSHFHLDAALSLGQPRFNESGTLLEGIAIWSEHKALMTVEHIKQRARSLCYWAIARGTLAMRSHVDVCDDRLLGVEALLEIKREFAPFLDIQLVAFPQDGYLRSKGSVGNLGRALDKGVEVVGGIPHIERTMSDGAESIRALCEIACERGAMVDMHCDENDDPLSRHIETLTFHTQRLELQGRVTASHLTSMHSMDNYYASKLLPLMAEANIHAVANPLTNIVLQGRHDTYPKRRGLMRVKEMMAQGINVAFGHDCVMDPWYSLGSCDMLQVAHMGLHVSHMTRRDELKKIFAAITEHGARVMGLEDYGLVPGKAADLVILQAANLEEAIRLQSNRLFVIRRGKVISESEPTECQLHLDGKRLRVDFQFRPELQTVF
jgi:cytosine/creatinine deaminase